VGDLASGHACDAFVLALADDIVTKFRSQLLDQTFGDKVRYYVMADTNWEVRLYAAIATGAGSEERFLLADAPIFWPTSDDIVEQAAEALELDEEEVRRRLERRAQEAELEAERSWQETLKQMRVLSVPSACPGWHITENGDLEPCGTCNAEGTVERVCEQAAAWARELPRHPRHQDHEECRACCGFDAFACHGSSTQGGHAILRSDACGVFDDDGVAQDAARSLYAERWTPCLAPDVGSHRAGMADEGAPDGDRR
jgi:hypothetical protein